MVVLPGKPIASVPPEIDVPFSSSSFDAPVKPTLMVSAVSWAVTAT